MMDIFYQLISRSGFFILKIAVHLLGGLIFLIFLIAYPFVRWMERELEGY